MTVVRVVDDAMHTCPTGTVGEIAVAGDPIMLGYANMPEVTRDTLRDGWVRTGDLGWMDAEGYVYLVDRKKDMIITGGENVYSSEVELVLARHPKVADAVVIGVPDDHWGERVHAVIVAVSGASPTPQEIQEFCREHLAGYKIPRSMDLRDSLPRLPTGKIAKGELRDEYWKGHARRIHGT